MKNSLKNINALQFYIFFAVIVAPMIIGAFTLLFDYNEYFWQSYFISIVVGEIVLFICYWGSHAIAFIEAGLYRKFLKVEAPSRSQFIYIFIGLILMFPGMVVGFFSASFLGAFVGIQFQAPHLDNYIRGYLIGGFNLILFLVFALRTEAKLLKQNLVAKQQELERQTLKARIEKLSMQMSPHLFFNTLNTIASMINSAPAAAEELTVELSKFYRHILEATKKNAYTLADEVEFCRSYLAIEHFRHQERVKYNIDIQETLKLHEIQFPALLLQPLVENAVRHGILASEKGGEVEISIAQKDGGYIITVLDNGVGFHNESASSGSNTALQNCKERLQLAFGDKAHFSISAGEQQGSIVRLAFSQ